MRYYAGPEAAVATSAAGGIGIMNPNAKHEELIGDFQKAKDLLATAPYMQLANTSPQLLPIGVAFLLWSVKLESAIQGVAEFRPAIVWLYAPTHGQAEVDDWIERIREASPATQVWYQLGTLNEVKAASSSRHPPDVITIQGTEAGGHSRTSDGSSWSTLLPEALDTLKHSTIPLFTAGGIVDGRGVAAALSLGASGACMGTRFLASTEARISKGYQDEILRTTDGPQATVKTHLWNHLMGTYGWPKAYTPRGIINSSYTDQQAGVPWEELQKRFDAASQTGDSAWGLEGRKATYAGNGVGMVHDVQPVGEIVERTRREARQILQELAAFHTRL